MRTLVRPVLAAVIALLALAGTARADFEYRAGQETAGPDNGVCPGIGILAKSGYYRNATGVEPRVDEPFYLEIRVTYFESFDCAASFTGIDVTLPSGLAPAAGGTLRVVCQRYRLNTDIADTRATANCPAAPVALGGSSYRLDPATVNFPDRPFAGRNYWFLGYDGANTFRTMRLLVPVVATSALSSATATFTLKRFDAATPWTTSVAVNATGTPAPPSGGGGPFVAPTLSVGTGAADVQTSPIGVRFPFATRKGSSDYGVSEKTVLGFQTPSGVSSAAGVPTCATNDYPGVFNDDQTGAEVLGDFLDPYLGPGDPQCDLNPGTQYTTRFCATWTNGTAQSTCRYAQYTTPAVTVDADVELSASNSRALRFTPVLRSARPAGTAVVRLTRPGQSEAQIGSASVARGTAQETLAFVDSSATAGDEYRPHTARACFTPTATGATSCQTAFTVVPGVLTVPATPNLAPGSATVTGAKFAAPNPALTAQLRVDRADADPAAPTDLPVVATQPLGQRTTSASRTMPDLVASGLTPGVRYAWTVCIKRDDTAAVAKCSPGQGFVAASPSSHVVTGAAAQDVTQTGAGLTATVSGAHLAGRLAFRVSTGGGAESEVAGSDLAAAGGDATRSATATGLTAGTTYSWRACFTSSLAVACSSPQQFVTTAAPAPAAPGAATPGATTPGATTPASTTQPGVTPPPGTVAGPPAPAGTISLVRRATVSRRTRQLRVGSADCPAGRCRAQIVLTVTPAVAKALGRRVPKGTRAVTIASVTRTISGTARPLTITLPAAVVARLGTRRSVGVGVGVTLSRAGATAVTRTATAGLRRG